MKLLRARHPASWLPLRAAGLVALVGLQACASGPALDLPAPPVAAVWPQGVQSPTADHPPAAPVQWRGYFTDPRLQALIDAALQNNRDLRIAVARVQEARAQYGFAAADRKPTVNLVGSGLFSKSPGDVGANGAAINGDLYDLSLSSISFEADLWGRLAGLSDAAKSNVLATQAAQRTVYISLIADVASAYFTVQQYDEMAALSQRAVQSREQTLQLVAKGRDAGAADEAQYQENLGILESVRTSAEATAYQASVARNRLQFLVGTMPAQLPAGLSLEQQSLHALAPAGLPSEVLLQRPDVIAAEYRLKAAHANVGAARAAFWPRILLTAGAGVASPSLASLFNIGSWTFQPAISLPIFDGGRNQAGKDLADARKEIAVAEYERTIQQAFREVSDLLAASGSTARQLRAAQATEQAQQYRVEAAQARARAGLSGGMEVLEAQRELLTARQNTVQIRRAQLDSAAQLYRALGGDTPPGAAQQISARP